MSEKYFEHYNCYQNIIFNQIETIGAQECRKNILSIVIKILFSKQIKTLECSPRVSENILRVTIVIKLTFFKQIETSAAQ